MPRRQFVPDRGQIIYLAVNPAVGHEQALPRPALVLTPVAFNERFGLALVAPITHRVRGHGFEVELTDTRTAGVVLCHQIGTIDFRARKARLLETPPSAVLEDVLAKVRTLVT